MSVPTSRIAEAVEFRLALRLSWEEGAICDCPVPGFFNVKDQSGRVHLLPDHPDFLRPAPQPTFIVELYMGGLGPWERRLPVDLVADAGLTVLETRASLMASAVAFRVAGERTGLPAYLQQRDEWPVWARRAEEEP